MAGLNARSAGEARGTIGVKLIDRRKWQVLKIGRERALRRGEHLCTRVLPGNLRSKPIRYDRLARNYLSALALVAVVTEWI